MKNACPFVLVAALGLATLIPGQAKASRHFWNPCEVVSTELCSISNPTYNVTVRLAKSWNKEGQENITPTSVALFIPVKKGKYELNMNVSEWKAWSRGEAEKDGIIYMTVTRPVWEDFKKDGLLTITLEDTTGSLPEKPAFKAVMSSAFDWGGDKNHRSYCMRAFDKEINGLYDEAIEGYLDTLDTYDADVWLFCSLAMRRCRLQAELEKLELDPSLATAGNYYKAGLYAMQSGLWKDAVDLFEKASALDAATAEKAKCCLEQVKKYAACEPWSETPASCPNHLPEGRELSIDDLKKTTGLDLQCWTNSVFFYVQDPKVYTKPAGAAYVRRYFKECRYFNNYLNLEGESDAAFRYVKEGKTNDLLFVRTECIAPFMAMLPNAKESFLGVYTAKNVFDNKGEQKLGVFSLPSSVIGDYPQDGADILKFDAGNTPKTLARAEELAKAAKERAEALAKAREAAMEQNYTPEAKAAREKAKAEKAAKEAEEAAKGEAKEVCDEAKVKVEEVKSDLKAKCGKAKGE